MSVFLDATSDSDIWEMLVVSAKVWFECLDIWLQGGAILLVVIAVLLMVLYLVKTLQRGRVNVSVVFLWFLVFTDFCLF